MRGRIVVLVGLAFAACARTTTTPAIPTPSPTPSGDYKATPTEWSLRSIGPDGRTIRLVYTMSGVASRCQRAGTTTADESADKVVVTAHKLVLQDRNRACTEELGYVESMVVLTSPLGRRALVGCRPPRADPSENGVCRDTSRSKDAPPPQPTPG